jgi:hypothetical protein
MSCLRQVIIPKYGKDLINESLAKSYDLYGIELGFHLTMFHIDGYYNDYWQKKLDTLGNLPSHHMDDKSTWILFPTESVVSFLMEKYYDLAE